MIKLQFRVRAFYDISGPILRLFSKEADSGGGGREGGDHQNALCKKSAIRKTTSSTTMTNRIRFNDFLCKKIASPFNVLPLTPSPALIRLCVSLCLLLSLRTVDPHASVCIYSLFFSCFVLLFSLCSFSYSPPPNHPPTPLTFFSFSHSPTHQGY